MPSKLIAFTFYNYEATLEQTGFVPDDTDCTGQGLVEFAGRTCYQSYDKPNAKTASLEDYINNIKGLAHTSVMEHGQLSFYFYEVSRSLTHELIRHRHFSYSQLSQRFVMPKDGDSPVFHPTMNLHEMDLLQKAFNISVRYYNDLITSLESRGITGKKAREVAREALPNATPTQIVVTGNYTAWRHFFATRGSEHADAAIRKEAVEAFDAASTAAPHIFSDFVVHILDDGSKALHTSLRRAY